MTEGLLLSPLGHLPVDLAKSQAGEEAEGSGGKSARETRTLGRPRSAQEALEFSTWVYSVEPGVEGAAARASGPAGAGGLPRELHAGGASSLLSGMGGKWDICSLEHKSKDCHSIT